MCTLGPATSSKERITELVEAGMDVARLNLSHGDYADHEQVYRNVRAAADEAGHGVGIFVDLQGPKIRLGKFKEGASRIVTGQSFTITTRDVPGTNEIASTTYLGLPGDVDAGDQVLIDDGKVRLRVTEVDGTDVHTVVVTGGRISNHKGINLPGVPVSVPAMSEKDVEDLRWALHLTVDYIALSFVRSAKDVEDVRKVMEEEGVFLPVIANHGAVRHFDVAVIGTGSGNSIIDERFADRRVAIMEEGTFGGTCLNVGCIPTKMYVYPADVARSASHGPRLGTQTSYEGARWPAIRDRIFGRVDAIAEGGERYRRGLDNVEVYAARATFLDDHTLDTGTGEQITADQVVIAAGSRVELPDLPGLHDVPFHTSDTVMRLPRLPRRMTILGGGYVAAEFAHVFSALGTAVTQVQRGPGLLLAQDETISATFTHAAQHQWDVRLDTLATGWSAGARRSA